MKQALLICLTSFFALGIQGQEILLNEQFNDGTLGVFTEFSVIGDGQMWFPDSFMDDLFAEMNGFDGSIMDNEDWLISPPLDMDQYADEVLTFESTSNFTGPDLELLASNDYDGTSDPNTATWIDLSDQVTWSAGDFEVTESGAIDLSAITGTGYIAFKYVSNTDVQGKLWQIDSIVVQASMLSSLEDELAAQKLISTPVVREGQLTFDVLYTGVALGFTLTSIEGRVVDQVVPVSGNHTHRIPVGNLPKGLYILVAQHQDFVKSYKVMIQ